jgi:hypothetical protein
MAFPKLFNKTIYFVAFLIYVINMRNYFDVDRIDPELLTDVQVSGPLEDQRVAFRMPFSACVCPSLVPEWLDGLHSYSAFKGLSIINGRPLNENILAPKTGTLQVKGLDFVDSYSNLFILYFSNLWGPSF